MSIADKIKCEFCGIKKPVTEIITKNKRKICISCRNKSLKNLKKLAKNNTERNSQISDVELLSGTSICILCKQEKLKIEFSIDRTKSSGHRVICKKCNNNNLITAICNFKSQAKQRNICWNLNKEDAIKIMSNPCYYCLDGLEIEHYDKFDLSRSVYYNGLDRVNNNKGYEINNVVSCCWEHNQLKSKFSIEELKERKNKIELLIKSILKLVK